jgi:hypothetical protein
MHLRAGGCGYLALGRRGPRTRAGRLWRADSRAGTWSRGLGRFSAWTAHSPVTAPLATLAHLGRSLGAGPSGVVRTWTVASEFKLSVRVTKRC